MPTPATLLGLPDNPADQTREALKLMRDMVRAGKKTPTIRETATRIVSDCAQKDDTCEVMSLWDWTLNNIRYIKDVNNVETVQPATRVLSEGAGDCNNKCVLLASLLESIGYKTRFVAFGKEPGIFTHVICEVRWGRDGWKSLDPTEFQPFGWRPTDMPYEMWMHN